MESSRTDAMTPPLRLVACAASLVSLGVCMRPSAARQPASSVFAVQSSIVARTPYPARPTRLAATRRRRASALDDDARRTDDRRAVPRTADRFERVRCRSHRGTVKIDAIGRCAYAVTGSTDGAMMQEHSEAATKATKFADTERRELIARGLRRNEHVPLRRRPLAATSPRPRSYSPMCCNSWHTHDRSSCARRRLARPR